MVLGQQFVGALNQPFTDLAQKVIDLASFGRDQLGVLVLLVPLAFVVTAVKRQPRYALLTGVSFLLTTLVRHRPLTSMPTIARYYLGPLAIIVVVVDRRFSWRPSC